MPDRPRCPTCRYWEPPDGGVGPLCRRYAPRAQVSWPGRDEDEVSDFDYSLAPVWPVTTENDWCGEHEPAHG